MHIAPKFNHEPYSLAELAAKKVAGCTLSQVRGVFFSCIPYLYLPSPLSSFLVSLQLSVLALSACPPFFLICFSVS